MAAGLYVGFKMSFCDLAVRNTDKSLQQYVSKMIQCVKRGSVLALEVR